MTLRQIFNGIMNFNLLHIVSFLVMILMGILNLTAFLIMGTYQLINKYRYHIAIVLLLGMCIYVIQQLEGFK